MIKTRTERRREYAKGAKSWAAVWMRKADDDDGWMIHIAYKGRSYESAKFFVDRRWSDAQKEGWVRYSIEETERGRRHNCFKPNLKKGQKCSECLASISGVYWWNGVAYCRQCFESNMINDIEEGKRNG